MSLFANHTQKNLSNNAMQNRMRCIHVKIIVLYYYRITVYEKYR